MSASRAWVFVGAAVAILPSVSSSESPSQDAQSQQYVVDSTGRSSVVTDGIGSCVHTGFWTAGNAIDSCPGDTIKSSAAAPTATQAQTAAESPAPPPAAPPPAPTAAAVPAPTPAPVATEEPPPPVVVAPVPERRDPAAQALAPEKQIAELQTAALPQAVHFSEDAFFDFDKAVLKPKGRELLDKLVAQLADVKYGTILVVGHTDRIGSAKYNQALSERRANAVRSYLVKAEIPPSNIRAVGRGKAEPLTDPGDCKGPVNPKVVACLQPDRRVDIEVSGTKE
jgi:OmpA-OmpF porin, OOP family